MIYNRSRVGEATGADVSMLPEYFSMSGADPVVMEKCDYDEQFWGYEPDMARDFLKKSTFGWFEPLLWESDEPEVSDSTLIKLMHNFIIPVDFQFKGLDFYPLDLSAPNLVNSFSEWWKNHSKDSYLIKQCVSQGLDEAIFSQFEDEVIFRFVPKFKIPWSGRVEISGNHLFELMDYLIKNPIILDFLRLLSLGLPSRFGHAVGAQ